MIKVHLDFETRSELNVKDVGAVAYAQHPSTEIMSIAYSVDDGPVQHITVDMLEAYWMDDGAEVAEVAELNALADDPEVIFCAHNAMFELCICWYVLNWKIAISRWRCTAAKAAARGLPRDLLRAGQALKCGHIKDESGNAAMKKLSRPKPGSVKTGAPVFYSPTDAPELFQMMYDYNCNDVECERDIDNALPDLSPFEQALWEIDIEMNLRGVLVDVEAVNAILAHIEHCTEQLNRQLREVTDGFVETGGQTSVIRQWLELQGVHASNLDKSTVRRLLKRDDLTPEVRTVLELRQILSKSSPAKYKKMLTRKGLDDVIRDLFLYHGAHTGRWAGRGVQLQNLYRPTLKAIETLIETVTKLDCETFYWLFESNATEVFASLVRSVLIARPGNRLLAADLSSIEARVTAWVSGQNDLLDAFFRGEDVYNKQASSIYGREINRKVDTIEGMVGKVSILALGYQGGIGAMASMAKNYKLDLTEAFESVWAIADFEERQKAIRNYKMYLQMRKDEDPDELLNKFAGVAADVIKQKWRQSNTHIVQFWYDVEEAAIQAVQTGELVKCGPVYFGVQGTGARRWLFCRLPSGRMLAYHKPKLKKSETAWGETKVALTYLTVNDKNRLVRAYTYGGKLTENIVQAISRDIMAYAMFNIHRKGYPLIMTVHDELVADAPKDFGSLDEFCTLMQTPPKWAAGIPVAAEGWEGHRYRK